MILQGWRRKDLTPDASSTYVQTPQVRNFPSASPHGSVDVLERSVVGRTSLMHLNADSMFPALLSTAIL